MPELPEVETLRRSLEPRLVGRRLGAARAFDHPKFSPALEVVGAVAEGVARRGKYLLIALDDGRELIVHLGMTGQLLVGGPGSVGPEGQGASAADRHERAAWRLDPVTRTDAVAGGDERWLVLRDARRFGRVRVVDAGDHASLSTLHALGPEPFDPSFTAEHLHFALARSRRAVKTQLLSQRPVAGVGNIYADEALWAAGIDPAARRLSRPRARRLRDALVEALAAGVEHGGTTLRDYRRSDGTTGSHQRHLRCYGRAGRPCVRCGAPLRRKVIDGRGTTWCATCQRR